jgi:hypothetical protein
MDERSIFMEALAKEAPAERFAYLREACGDDRALRQRVEALLASHELAGSFLGKAVPERLADKLAAVGETRGERPPAEAVPGGDASAAGPAAQTLGNRIGPYKLLQHIGEGGMGTVFLAEQSEPVRRLVALKIIKPGMDSRQVIARFEAANATQSAAQANRSFSAAARNPRRPRRAQHADGHEQPGQRPRLAAGGNRRRQERRHDQLRTQPG